MTDEQLRKSLAVAFEYSYQHADWVTPLEDALDGLSIEQALWTPDAEGKSIWEIVLHLAVWNQNIVDRVKSGEISRPAEGSWPPGPAEKDVKGWNAAQGQLWHSLGAVKKMIEETPIDQIEASPYGVADLLCRLTHNGYHIGQIVKLRDFQTARPNL